MQRLTVDLKTYLGLAMPNQCCHVVIILILGWFVGGIFFQETPTLNDPYICDWACKNRACGLKYTMSLMRHISMLKNSISIL